MKISKQLEDTETVLASKTASDFLRDQILSGKMVGGQKLKTEEIAHVLGISRMPVRDALQLLHSEGLVEMRPNKGAFVTNLGPSDIEELFEIRAALEALAASAACTAVMDFGALEACVREMLVAANDKARWLDAHERFHDALIDGCGKPKILHHVKNVRRSLLPYIRLYINVFDRFEVQDADHEFLLNVARRRNPGLMESVMRDHVRSTATGVVAYLHQRQRTTGV